MQDQTHVTYPGRRPWIPRYLPPGLQVGTKGTLYTCWYLSMDIIVYSDTWDDASRVATHVLVQRA